MTYEHDWEEPIYARLGGAMGAYVPIQQCHECGTRRNPITRRIVTYGSNACRLPDGEVADPTEHPGALKALRQELAKLEAAGERVLRYWEGESVEPDPEALAQAVGM